MSDQSMSEESPSYLVDTSSDPVHLKIIGRASYLNCAPVSKLFARLIEREHRRFLLDFGECTGMDSTVLGILAGVAMEVRRMDPPGTLLLARLSTRNRELVENLGLHRIMTIVEGDKPIAMEHATSVSGDQDAASQEIILQAHECLIEADERNVNKFQDVVAFLKKQIEQE